MLQSDAMALLQERYLRRDAAGRVTETFAAMCERVATCVAAAEREYGGEAAPIAEKFFHAMSTLAFLPNTPTLVNAGRPRGQLAACFVLPLEDSLTGIFTTLRHAALIHQSGGGTGFSFSALRPAGDVVHSTGGRASGPLSFMKIFDVSTDVVRQGSVRRGANMGVLRVDHPDIGAFVTAKRDGAALTNFNLSVGVTDAFMQAVRHGASFDLVNPRTGAAAKKVAARSLFASICHQAWENGEPGLFFLDTANRANPTPRLGAFASPNPCSEQPLLPYESCTLGSINLNRVLRRDPDWTVDYEELRRLVHLAVRFLDDVITVNAYPLPEVAAQTLLTRKIGLGIMGLADVFIKLDLPYASDTAVRLTRRLMQFITGESRRASATLALRRGPFPAFRGSVFDVPGGALMRNATVTTIAPTGSISIIAGCSSGIEPLYALALTRRVLSGRELPALSVAAMDYLAEHGLFTPQIEQAIRWHGRLPAGVGDDHVRAVLATARDIAPRWHVAQLAAAQQFTDNGVSKTVNLPQQATVADVEDIFWQAYNSGCKGITVYRDGSRTGQVLTEGIHGCATCEM